MSNDNPVCEHCGQRHKNCAPSNVEAAALEYIDYPRRVQTLTIPGRLAGLNEIIKSARTHWSHGAKQKIEQEETVMWAIKQSRLKPIARAFRMELLFVEPNDKRDPDNIVSAKKFILDALQKMGIIINDNQKYVRGWSERWEIATSQTPTGIYVKLIED